jgi:catechol 2,3-dioxygenase-like lactoylglutathione lyase family enzyme
MTDIRYLVHDVDTALAFYTQLLGFEERERWGPAFAIVAQHAATGTRSTSSTTVRMKSPRTKNNPPAILI